MIEKNTRKVLLVDDERAVGKAICLLLERKNYDVTLVDSVDDAEKVLENESIDVCITDLSLPGRNGIDLLRHIRESESLRDMPVIVLSGFVSVIQEELAAYNPFRIFKKPPPTEELFKALETVFKEDSNG